MGKPQETDERLRSWLDSNQLARERLCLAILSLDRRFSNVRPRQPRGGPDMGRDLEATFRDGRRAFGAVGFVNSASDSPANKRAVKRKFRDDLRRALQADNNLKIFVFFTNVSLTVGEKKTLEDHANSKGIEVLDIFDRERLRIALDSTDGLAARLQYLGIQMSDAEQAAFFARWGKDVEQLITASAGAVDTRLDRLEFIQEQNRPLHSLFYGLKLRREVTVREIPHVRALMTITFAPITLAPHGQLNMLVCNEHGEWEKEGAVRLPGYSGNVGLAWGRRPEFLLQRELFHQPDRFNSVSTRIFASRFGPAILGKTLGDLDHALVAFFANRAIADLMDEIVVTANEYIVWKTSAPQLEASRPETTFPVEFTSVEMEDPWIQIKGDITSGWFDFSRFTPRRMFVAEAIG
jgi:hypothetical protein